MRPRLTASSMTSSMRSRVSITPPLRALRSSATLLPENSAAGLAAAGRDLCAVVAARVFLAAVVRLLLAAEPLRELDALAREEELLALADELLRAFAEVERVLAFRADPP